MEKKRNVQGRKSKKKKRPKVRFNFGVLLMICLFSFAICFVLYMLAANMNNDFLNEEFGISSADMVDTESKDKTSNSNIKSNSDDDGISANPVPQSASADKEYLSNCCLLTDKTLLGIDSFGNNVFGGENIGVTTAMTEKVESTFGTLSVYDIAKQKKPQTLYIMLGSDMGTATVDEMIVAYSKLVSSLKSAISNVKIYVMEYPPALYDSDTVTNDMINDYNARLLSMCNDLGVYCIDTNTALKAEDGKLNEEFWSYETLSLSQQGYDRLSEYILNHIAE